MEFFRINQKRIQEVFVLLFFAVFAVTSLAPQILTVNKASASLFSYPEIKLNYTPALPKPDGHPLKSSSQDVLYPEIKESDSQFYYEANLAAFKVWFYDKAQKQAITRIGVDEEHFLDFFVPNEKKVPIELTDQGYSYQISPDLEINYSLKQGRLKEDIIISQKPAAKSFRFEYKKQGIFLEEVEGEYYFYHKDNLNQLFKFQKPTIIDASGQSGDISLEITKKEIIFHFNQDFLNNAKYPITIDPVTVGTTTSTTGTGPDKDRHIVRTARGIIVKVWYQNTTNYLVGSRSLDDGETWLQLSADSAGATAIGGDANTDGSYSIFADSSSNVNVAYTSVTCDNSGAELSICYRLLTFSASTEQYSVGSETLVSAGTSTVPIDFPSIVETSNGYLYVAGDAEGSTGAADQVAIRVYNGTSWATETGTQVNSADDPVLIMEPGTNERMYFYWKTADTTLYFNYYNGTAWVGEGSIANIGATPLYSTAVGSALPGDVHLVYTNSGVYYLNYNGTSWGSNATLASTEGKDAVISYNGGDLFVFSAVTEGTVERIQYKRKTGGSWDSNWTYVSDIIDTFESVQTYDYSITTYTNETTDAGDYGTTDLPFLDDPTNDYLYVGRDATFSSVTFFLSTVASSTVTPDWEYWNGSAWTDITETDNTTGFTISGKDVNWGTLTGWATTSVNGVSKYWVRVIGGSSPSTKPTASYILPEQHADSTTSVERVVEETTIEQTNQDGFGDTSNQELYTLEVFDDYLYAGTSHASAGAELWRSDDGIDWSQVSTNGFGNTNNSAFTVLETAGEYLYVGTNNSTNGAQVWRSTNGVTGFSQVNSNGFGNTNNAGVGVFAVFENYLYAGTTNTTNGAQIWRCDVTNCDASGDWSQVNTSGFGATNIGTTVLIGVNLGGTEYLYAGTRQTGGGDLWRCSDASGCNESGDWASVSTDGFGDSFNTIMRSAEVFNSYLYVGTFNSNAGTELWRCDTTANGACDANADFSQINTNGFGDANNTSINTIKSYYGNYLYVGTTNTSTGAELWRCTLASGCDINGDFSQINSDGFGDATNDDIQDFQIFRDYMYSAVSDSTDGPTTMRNFYERISVGWTAGSSSPFNVKYDEIRYRARQENWRWYDDQTSATPSIDFAAENTAASGVHKMNAIRLRITLREDGHFDAANIRMKLQYSTDNALFFDVGATDDTYAPWHFFNGGGTDDSAISTRNLSDSDTAGPYVEELSVVSTFDHGAQDWTEWDFSLENYNGTANATYYFRAVWSDSEEEVILTSGKSHPSLTTTSSYTLSLSGPSSVTLPSYTLGSGSGNSVYTFNSSEKITMRDDTGAGAGWTVTGVSTDLTESHSWSSSNPWDSNNTSVQSLAVYSSYLYAGTYNATGAEIWRTNDGSTWTAVVDSGIDGNGTGSDENGFGDANNVEIRSLLVFNSYLYATTRNESTGIEIWRTNAPDGGDNWTQINTDGFGDANNYWADSFAVLSNDAPGVYIGTEKNTPGTNGGAELWKCTTASGCDGTGDWSQVNSDGFGDNLNEAIDSLQEFGSNLYVGIDRSNSSAAELWRCNTSLSLCSINSNYTLVDDTGLGNSSNTAITSLASFSGNLYAFTENGTNGTQAWRCPTASGCDAVGDFLQTNQNGFGLSGNTNTLTAYVWESDYNYLYAGINNAMAGAEVYWSEDGNNWNDANVGGGEFEKSTLDLMALGNNIYAGMSKNGGIPGVGANIKKSADADIIIASDINWSTGSITALLAASSDGVSAGAGGAMDPDTSVTVATANGTGCTPDPPGCGAGGYTIQPTLTVSGLDNEDDGSYSATMTLTIQ